jgi:hypothetical protein
MVGGAVRTQSYEAIGVRPRIMTSAELERLVSGIARAVTTDPSPSVISRSRRIVRGGTASDISSLLSRVMGHAFQSVVVRDTTSTCMAINDWNTRNVFRRKGDGCGQ